MNLALLSPELIAMLGAGFWHAAIVFLRIGAMTSVMPGFGETFFPTHIRLVIGLVFTAIVAPTLPQITPPTTILQYVAYIGSEVVIGLGLGISLRFFVHALQTAGSIAAQTTSLAQLFGGQGVDPMPALGAILWISGLALVFLLGLHLRAAELMIQSYDIFPVGLRPEAAGFSQWGIFRISQSFAMAFTLAAPFVVTAVIYNLTLGLINRAMPQLMVFFIGAPAITFGGLVILAIGSPLILIVWSRGLSEFIMNPAVGMP